MRRPLAIVIFSLFLLSLACGGSSGDGEEPPDGAFQIKVVNRSPYDVCYVQISVETDEEWGDDLMAEDEIIEPGDSRSFDLDEGTYDVMLRDCDAIPVESASEVSSDVTITVGASGVVGLLLDNQSSTEICYVFISLSDNEEWGSDWLGGAESIFAGEQRVFYVDTGVYDLLAQDCVGEGSDLVEELAVDLTDDWSTWTIYDD
ncbi:MAG: hypothetical protein GQ526_02260 [Ardenticatenales bacterium]|nr:hypothetical protein [Ardenticatenales bacterium]